MSLSREYQIIEKAAGIVKSIDATRHPVVLDELVASYNSLVDEFKALRAHAPVYRTFELLPTELKHRIFQEVCFGSQRSPLLLSRVCKQWRNLVHHSSDLWTSIAIDAREQDWTKILAIYAVRSAERLLDITLYIPVCFTDIKRAISYAKPHRWKSLTVLDRLPSAQRVALGCLPMIAPWVGSSPQSDPYENSETALLQLLATEALTNLEDIDVRVKPSVGFSLQRCLWSNLFAGELLTGRSDLSASWKPLLLTHLTLVTGTSRLMEDLRSAVIDAPGLKYLKVSTYRAILPQTREQMLSSRRYDQPTLALRQLKELKIQDDNIQFLLGIDCPNVETLEASMLIEEMPTLTARLSTFPSLKTLKLTMNTGPHVELKINNAVSIPLVNLTIHHRLDMTYPNAGLHPDALYSFLEFFPSVSRLELSSQHGSFDWARCLRMFPRLVHASIQHAPIEVYPRLCFTDPDAFQLTSNQFQLTTSQNVTHLPDLRYLRVRGGSRNMALSTISAPTLKELILVGLHDLPFNTFTSFIRRSPAIVRLHLEGVHMVVSDYEPAPSTITSKSMRFILADERGGVTSMAIQDLHTTDDAWPILIHLHLPHVRKLRLVGSPQRPTAQGLIAPLEPHRIWLSTVLGYRRSLLASLQVLDLCPENTSSPIVIGLAEVLPHLVSLHSISLPRAPPSAADVLVDVLIQEMLKWGQGAYICPRLTNIHTQDYPDWESLLKLLGRRNRTVHIIPDPGNPFPLESICLPASPHPSILTRLRLALAGKFPSRREDTTEDGAHPKHASPYFNRYVLELGYAHASSIRRFRCDDCTLTGWKCSGYGIDRDSSLRSSCERHQHCVVRVTASC